jgi:tRNA A37 N6-isopentenylltransferase MiaA
MPVSERGTDLSLDLLWENIGGRSFALNMILQNSRRYAKKQLNWFNRDEEIRWFHPAQEGEIMEVDTGE